MLMSIAWAAWPQCLFANSSVILPTMPRKLHLSCTYTGVPDFTPSPTFIQELPRFYFKNLNSIFNFSFHFFSSVCVKFFTVILLSTAQLFHQRPKIVHYTALIGRGRENNSNIRNSQYFLGHCCLYTLYYL